MCPTAPKSVSHIVTFNYLAKYEKQSHAVMFFLRNTDDILPQLSCKIKFLFDKKFDNAAPKDVVTKNSGMTHYITVWLLNVQLLKRK